MGVGFIVKPTPYVGQFLLSQRETRVLTLEIIMEKEQLKEVAKIIHEKLSKKKHNSVIYNHNKVRDASLNIHQNNEIRNKAMKHDLGLASAKIEEKILTSIGKILDILNDYKNQLTSEKEGIDEKYCLAELTACNNTYKSLVYEDGCLKVTTDKIVLQNIDLGRFEVIISVQNIHESPSVFLSVNALEPNFACGGSSYPHPHVEDTSLCMGEGYSLICDAAQQGRIEDVFNLAINILSNYNDSSPYHSLDEWESSICQRCDESYDPDNEGSCCEICDRNICDNCSSYCESCSRSICTEHVEKSCDICDTYSCGSCSENSRCCDECGSVMCEDCSNSCQVCDNSICEECSKVCESCENNICKSHVIKCNVCEKGICESCEQECKCGSLICTECHDEEKLCCSKEEEDKEEEKPVTPPKRTRRPRTTS